MSDPIQLKRIDQTLFNQVADKARQRSRLRQNHNFHQESEMVQRFLNVLQPGTYVRPHRHVRDTQGEGFECFLVLQGSIGLLVFDSHSKLILRERLDADGPLRGIELAENQMHTLVALEADTVMFELKQGPYRPSEDKDFLAGFPKEGTKEATDLEQTWRSLFNASDNS